MKKLISAFLLVGFLFNPKVVLSQQEEPPTPALVAPIPMACYSRENYGKIFNSYHDLAPAVIGSTGVENKMKLILFVSPSTKKAMLVNRLPANTTPTVSDVLYCIITVIEGYEIIPVEKIEKSEPA